MPDLSRLRICLAVSGFNEGGGIERHVADLAHGLVDRHSVYVLAHESFQTLFDDRVEFHAVGFSGWRYNPMFLRNFVRTLKSLKPSLIHAHGRKAAQVVSLTRRFVDAPCVLTVHNLSRDDRLYRGFESVIAVSSLVARGVNHPNLHLVPNGS